MTQWTNGYGIVLGCSSGVGAAIARRLATLGYGVVGFHRGNHPEEAAATEAAIRACAVPCYIRQADAGSTQMAAADAFAPMAGGFVDKRQVRVLVHSLSGASMGDAMLMSSEKVEKTFNNLAHSFLWWVQWLVRAERFHPNATAIALSNPCPDFYLRSSGVVGPAKAALEAYVGTLACELRGKPTVNAIRFSTVVTPALRKVMPSAIERLDTLHKAIVPAGRIQECDDVADAVDLLLSPQAAWLNGAIIDATGGSPRMLMDYAFHGARKA